MRIANLAQLKPKLGRVAVIIAVFGAVFYVGRSRLSADLASGSKGGEPDRPVARAAVRNSAPEIKISEEKPEPTNFAEPNTLRDRMLHLLKGASAADYEHFRDLVVAEATSKGVSPMVVASDLITQGLTREGRIARIGCILQCFPSAEDNVKLYACLPVGDSRVFLVSTYLFLKSQDEDIGAIKSLYAGMPLGSDRVRVAREGADLSMTTGGFTSFCEFVGELEMPEEKQDALLSLAAKRDQIKKLDAEQRARLWVLVNGLDGNQRRFFRDLFNLK
jgi:hypothetical protein